MPRQVFALAGKNGAGKDTIARIFQALWEPNVSIAETGKILEDEARKSGIENPAGRVAKQVMYVRLRKVHGDCFLHPRIQNVWDRDNKPYCGLNAVRLPWDVEFIQGFPRSFIVFVDASLETRYGRVKKRTLLHPDTAKPDELHMTFDEFVERDEFETERFIESIKKLPGVIVINNDGDIRSAGAELLAALLNRELIDREGLPQTQVVLENLYQEVSPR